MSKESKIFILVFVLVIVAILVLCFTFFRDDSLKSRVKGDVKGELSEYSDEL